MKLIYQYDEKFDTWLFTTEERAKEYINSWKAFQATTWGEFRELIPKESYAWISEILIERQFEDQLENDNDFKPGDDEPFDHWDFTTYSEYPGYLVYEHEDYFPESILKKYGEVVITMHDGAYYRFEKSVIDNLIDDLQKLGFELEHRKDIDFT